MNEAVITIDDDDSVMSDYWSFYGSGPSTLQVKITSKVLLIFIYLICIAAFLKPVSVVANNHKKTSQLKQNTKKKLNINRNQENL